MAEDPTPKPEKRKRGPGAGRPRKLVDPQKRKLVITVLQVGGTRADAAVAAGVNHTTLNDECRRDTAFAADLKQAEIAGKIVALKTIHGIKQSSDEPTALKAATWYLERKFYEEFGRRNAKQVPLGPLINALAQMTNQILTALPAKHRETVGAIVRNTVTGLDAISQ